MDAAFKYLSDLHPGINAYTKTGTGPIKAVARGETAVSISFVHDAVAEAEAAVYAGGDDGAGKAPGESGDCGDEQHGGNKHLREESG